jgi:hypothetical protein
VVRKSGESGFALLLVFLMAAAIALSLYMEIPRVAFESQRQKEQLLVERGEQFKRAIQVYYVANGKKWPNKIEDLESTNNRHFLRHRYIDPMTGKDEWRLVHTNGANVLIDSAINKAKTTSTGSSSTAGQFISEQAGLGQQLDSSQASGAALANRRRASDSAVPGSIAEAGDAATGSTASTATGTSATQTTDPTASASTSSSGTDASASTASTDASAQASNSAASSAGGTSALSASSTASQNAATSMIQNMLTTPRPGGFPGSSSGQSVGGGLAGVASTLESDSIMVYNDQNAYNLWEFVFDPSKVRTPPNPMQTTGTGSSGSNSTTNKTTTK